MRYVKGTLILTIFFIFSYLVFPREAYAYLDLGSGSFIFQLLMGALLGILFTIKVYWQKIKSFFIKSYPKNKDHK